MGNATYPEAPHRPVNRRQRRDDRGPHGSADAANDAVLGRLADPEEDSLRAVKGFATGTAAGAVIWLALAGLAALLRWAFL